MASAATTGGRRAKRIADRRAAKERRQLYTVIGLGVLLLLLVVYELPKFLHRSGGGGGSVAATAPATPTPTTTGGSQRAAELAQAHELRAALRRPARNVFEPNAAGSPSTLGGVANPPGLRDPFALPSAPSASRAPVVKKPASSTSEPLPKTIILGTPGAGRVPVKGWIVILASIPTREGQTSARSFATAAGHTGVGKVSVLNSSNRRPLRGGYWVVYTGPYNTLSLVNAASSHVHTAGFPTAYIRELIVYRKR